MTQSDQEEEQVDYGGPVGRAFFDKLLLAIIDAYTEPENSPDGSQKKRPSVTVLKKRVDRLRAAKEALLGQSHEEGRPLVSDEAVLRWMGSERYKDCAKRDMAKINGGEPPKLRSDRKLADGAAKKFRLPAERAESLRKKFGLQCEKWMDVARYHDDVPEALDFSLLDQIQAILAKRGIAMNLKWIER